MQLGPRADEPPQRHAARDRLHRLDRGARRRHHRHLRRRSRAHHLGRDRRVEGQGRHRHARATSSRWSRATAACWCAPAIPRRRSMSRGSPGSIPSGVICEIMNDDGTMARMDDLVAFAQLHDLKIGTIRDLIAYRRRHDHLVEKRAEARFASGWGGDWTRDDLLQQGDRQRAGGAGQGHGSIPPSRRWCGCTRCRRSPTSSARAARAAGCCGGRWRSSARKARAWSS